MNLRSLIFISVINLLVNNYAIGQTTGQNLVNNPDFSQIDQCPFDLGQINFAFGWQSDNFQSPDLYDTCGLIPILKVPIDFTCAIYEPYSGTGYAGIVTTGILPSGTSAREIISSRLTDTLPLDVDIYCSLAVRPYPRCDIDPEVPLNFCLTNGIGMSMQYFDSPSRVILEREEVLSEINDWTVLRGCYEAIGGESRIQIRNFKGTEDQASDCITSNPLLRMGYTFIDNAVVAPFDILPDTLFVCDIQQQYFGDINFFDLPLSWDDDVEGGMRTFEETGTYVLLADATECILEEPLEVVIVREEEINETRTLSKCVDEPLNYTLDLPGEISWEGGPPNPNITINQPGTYVAEVITECKVLVISHEVVEVDCNEALYAGNIFSPNGDGVNDEVVFYPNPSLNVQGTLAIFDRWGTEVFAASGLNNLRWNGLDRFGNEQGAGVYVWVFVSADESVVQRGDVTLIR